MNQLQVATMNFSIGLKGISAGLVLTYLIVLLNAERDYEILVKDMDWCISSEESIFQITKLKAIKCGDNRYCTTVEGDLNIDFPEDATCEVQGFERYGNDYGRSTLNLPATKCCDLIANDTCFYPTVVEKSNLPTACPIAAGQYSVEDYVLDVSCLPDSIPGSDQWRFDALVKDGEGNVKYCIQLFIQFEKLDD